MAALTTQQRRNALAKFMRAINFDPEGHTKPVLLACVNGLDDFLEANASAINQALHVDVRGAGSSINLKASLLQIVAEEKKQAAG
jgi:hypothetical protein